LAAATTLITCHWREHQTYAENHRFVSIQAVMESAVKSTSIQYGKLTWHKMEEAFCLK